MRRYIKLILLSLSIPGWSQPSNQFKKITLTNDFISEGVAVGDVNQDGQPDIMTGAYWFAAPDWYRNEIVPGKTYNPETDYSNSFLNFSMDVNQDTWIDLIVVDFPGTTANWFENPKNKHTHWKKHLIYETVSNESPAFVDVDNDGRMDLLCADPGNKQIIWLKSPQTKGATSWTKYTISVKNAPGTDVCSVSCVPRMFSCLLMVFIR